MRKSSARGRSLDLVLSSVDLGSLRVVEQALVGSRGLPTHAGLLLQLAIDCRGRAAWSIVERPHRVEGCEGAHAQGHSSGGGFRLSPRVPTAPAANGRSTRPAADAEFSIQPLLNLAFSRRRF